LCYKLCIGLCYNHVLQNCQGLEIGWRDNYTCPSLEEYKQMIKKSKDRTEP